MTLLLTVDRILAATAVKMDGYDKRDIIVRPSSGPERRRDYPTCYRGMISVATACGISRNFPIGVIDAFGHLCGNLPGRSERMSETRAAGMTAPACST